MLRWFNSDEMLSIAHDYQLHHGIKMPTLRMVYRSFLRAYHRA